MAEMILLKNNANTVFGNTAFKVTLGGSNAAVITLKTEDGDEIWSLPLRPLPEGSTGSFRVAKGASDTFESTETVTCSTY